jgi:pyruvate dehydrogenase E2 component (dihydrolipoamide acetyltransferase)
MPIDILMPALSPTMKRGKLARWIKKEGDMVEPGEVIAEIETDKAIMEVESVDSGVLFKILVPEGTENVPVNAKIGILLEEGEQGQDPKEILLSYHIDVTQKVASDTTLADFVQQDTQSLGQDKLQEPKTSATSKESFDKDIAQTHTFASPLARRMAKDRSLELSQISGTGPRGRIVKSDVLNFHSTGARSFREEIKQVVTSSNEEGNKITAHSSMRRAIAQKLSQSKREIPHFYLALDCQMDALIKLRGNINQDLNANISIGDFVLKASAYALQRVPSLNACWSEDGAIIHDNIDVCVAVGLEEGLITPVIFQADKKNLLHISSEVKDLAVRAKEKKLTPKEYQGGSFTVSNLGMYGISEFSAIINYPQSAILAVGAIRQEVFLKESCEGFASRSVMKVTLSCDHRLLDGKVAAQWLSEFKGLIEKPLRLIF